MPIFIPRNCCTVEISDPVAQLGKNGVLPEGHLHKYWRRQNGHGQAIETVYELFSAIYICYILSSKMRKKT